MARLHVERRFPTGGIELSVPAAQVVVIHVWGHLDVAIGDFMLDFMEQRLATTDRCFQAFHDWSEVETYDTMARLRLTAWIAERRDRFEAIHVLSGSRLVSMGIAVANLALDRFINAYNQDQRARYEAALSEALARKTPPRS